MPLKPLRPREPQPSYTAMFVLAALLMMADGAALRFWADGILEHYVLASLAISAEFLLLACAIKL